MRKQGHSRIGLLVLMARLCLLPMGSRILSRALPSRQSSDELLCASRSGHGGDGGLRSGRPPVSLPESLSPPGMRLEHCKAADVGGAPWVDSPKWVRSTCFHDTTALIGWAGFRFGRRLVRCSWNSQGCGSCPVVPCSSCKERRPAPFSDETGTDRSPNGGVRVLRHAPAKPVCTLPWPHHPGWGNLREQGRGTC